MFRFNCEESEGILKAVGQVKVAFKGKVKYENEVSSGIASFEGNDLMKVIEKGSKKDKTKK
jgi:hypothetical protein